MLMRFDGLNYNPPGDDETGPVVEGDVYLDPDDVAAIVGSNAKNGTAYCILHLRWGSVLAVGGEAPEVRAKIIDFQHLRKSRAAASGMVVAAAEEIVSDYRRYGKISDGFFATLAEAVDGLERNRAKP